MYLGCRNGFSLCTGCGSCSEAEERCDACGRDMAEGERYYRLSRKNICEECATEPEGQICILCRRPARDGFRYKDVVLCRSCSGVATGYVGYI